MQILSTRPDIAFAVRQVTHFSYSPKQSHAHDIKQIVCFCYLAHTWDKGTMVKPTTTLQLDCYMDADFAGLYNCNPHSSPTSAKSCLSYIISLGGVPLVWHSQLQSEISLSTLESKYSSLSQGASIREWIAYLTKGFAREAFEWICKINQGW
jgi:hypothetical protein